MRYETCERHALRDVCATCVTRRVSDMRYEMCERHALRTCERHVLRDVALYILTLVLGVLKTLLVPFLLNITVRHLWRIYVTSLRDRNCLLPLPPGEFGLPIIGETVQMLLNMNEFTRRKRAQYGDVYVTHFLGNPTVRVCGAKHVRSVLRGKHTTVEAVWPRSTQLLLGAGSLSQATGQDHLTKKRALMKTFSFDALSKYVPTVQGITQTYIHFWLKKGIINGYEELRTLNFALSCRVLIGATLDRIECQRLMNVFETFTSNIFSMPVNMRGFGFWKALGARQVLMDKIDEVIQSRRQRSGVEEKDNVLSIILQSNDFDDFSQLELKNMCLELLFAGHGTTSSAESYLVYVLTKRPDVCRKIREEMTSYGIFTHDLPLTDSLSLQLLNKLTYLNSVVKEVLRISPPVGGGFRQALETFEINGYQVPKGWKVVYSIANTHNITGHFQDPTNFDPDRWSNKQTSGDPWGYLPFGGGRRACAGKDLARLMLKVFAVELLGRCDVGLLKDDTVFRTFPLPSPKDGMPLYVRMKSQ
ncbi:cytochrome P450 26A1-like [Mya arenaria]|uniref:cytochrome P450 26A1-like n=1 Tax=Mya arenaria TaxID=6604 RepID=UPI0022E73F1B|nr:cytochrome P450 26A1-like [Mya arenaria]